QGHQRPRRDRLPAGPGGLVLEGRGGDRALRGGHERGRLLWDVGGEDRAELALLDVEVLAAAGRQRDRHERGTELASGELARELAGALTGLEEEAGDEHQGAHVVGSLGGLARNR